MSSSLGTLFIISAPSGGGKTSLVKALIKKDTQILVSVSHTTRNQRPEEIPGVHYHFVDLTHFNNLKVEGEFLECAQVFDNWYGTSRKWVEDQLSQGFDVILEIDWQGARRVQELMDCVTIFIFPPSKAVLLQRLQERQQDDWGVINKRMQKASHEMSHFHEYHYLIINDIFEEALTDLESIIRARRKSTFFQAKRWAHLISELTA